MKVIALALALTVSGASHTYLYLHGYHHIPMIGTAFLVQASVSLTLALLIVIGGPSWLQWAAAALAGGSVAAFVLSRTVGLLGFSERGWQPYPHAAISLVAELLAVGLWAAGVLSARWPRAALPSGAERRRRRRRSHRAAFHSGVRRAP